MYKFRVPTTDQEASDLAQDIEINLYQLNAFVQMATHLTKDSSRNRSAAKNFRAARSFLVDAAEMADAMADYKGEAA